jgi:hypothetical protein
MKKTVQMNFQNVPVEFKDALTWYKQKCNQCTPHVQNMPLRDWFMRVMWAEFNRAALDDPLAAEELKTYRKRVKSYSGDIFDQRLQCQKFGLACATCKNHSLCTEENPQKYERISPPEY